MHIVYIISITVYSSSSADLLNMHLDFTVTQLDLSTDCTLVNLKKHPNKLFCEILQIPSFFLFISRTYVYNAVFVLYLCSCCWMEGSGFENTSLQRLLLWPRFKCILSYWKKKIIYFSPPWKISVYFQWILLFMIKDFLVSQKIKYVMLKNFI